MKIQIVLLFISLATSLSVRKTLLSTEAPSSSTAKTKTSMHLPLKHLSTQNYFDRITFAPHIQSPDKYKGMAYVAEIYIGTQPRGQYLHVDTGSPLTWTNCYPCSNCIWDHMNPRYYPQDSSTYYTAGYCKSTPSGANPSYSYSYLKRKCTYAISYVDGNYIRGTLSTESFNIKTLDGGFEVLRDVYFGCNDEAVGDNYIGSGILGLGLGDYSIVERLGSMFSLCFGRMLDPKSTHNLIFGNGAMMSGTPTIINITDGHYLFELDTIFVGAANLNCYPTQVYLDTGSTITSLSKKMYDFIERQVKDIMRSFEKVKFKELLCYRVHVDDIPDYVDIGFIFAGRATISVDLRSLFLPNGSPGTMCMGITWSSDEKIIIGAVITMQGYNFGYDLKQNRVYILHHNVC